MFQDFSNNNSSIKDLLNQYEGLRMGHSNSFLEEDDFETLCDYFEEQENLKKALEIVSLGITNHPFSAILKIRKADILISLDKDAEAETLLEEAFLLDHLDFDYYILKFELKIKQQQFVDAEQFMTNSLPLFDQEDKIDILEQVVRILIQYFEHDKITQYLLNILTIDGSNEFALIEIPFWSKVTNQIEETIDIHLHIVQEQPYNHLAWFNLGISYQRIGLYEKSIEAYEFCLAICEDFEFAICNLSNILLTTKKYHKAISHLDALVNSLERPDSKVYTMLALSYVGIKNYNLAIKNYKAALALEPQNADLYFLLAKVFFVKKKYLDSIDICKKASAINISHPQYQELLGRAYFELKQYKTAAHHFFNSLIVKKSNSKLWCQYLNCFLLSQQYEMGYEKANWAFNFTHKNIFRLYAIGFLLLNNEEAEAKDFFEKTCTMPIKTNRSMSLLLKILNNYKWLQDSFKQQK